MEEEAGWIRFCMETEHLTPGASLYGDPILHNYVSNPRLRLAAAELGRYEVESCENVSDLCDRPDAGLLRIVCGRTCGCTDPHSKVWFKVPALGCSEFCLQMAEDALKASEICQDVAPDSRWSELWDAYIPALSYKLGTDVTASTTFFRDIQNQIAAMKGLGCSALLHPELNKEYTSQRFWCEGDPELFRAFGYYCPVSCGCRSGTPPKYCPPQLCSE
ncbi:unnamed protein product [Durusdinium trenchii]|uniref:Uncharacterized protein n=1 Tax=Durusdinium trenchii TaxID=1381693 RepID=A0ABP0LQE3_9DINO